MPGKKDRICLDGIEFCYEVPISTTMDNTVEEVKASKRRRYFSIQRSFLRYFARAWMGFALLISDGISLLISGTLALFLWSFIRPDLVLHNYIITIPLILVFVLIYTAHGLYPAVGISPVEELRLLSVSTTVVFLLLGTLTFYIHNFQSFSRAAFGIAWVFAIIFLPISRHLTRKIWSAVGGWGEPIALIGFGNRGTRLLSYLKEHPTLGYKPVVIIDGFSSAFTPPLNIPYYREAGKMPPPNNRDLAGVKTAIIIKSEVPETFLLDIIDGRWHKFHDLIMISENQKTGSVWIEPHDIGGIIGLQVKQNLFNNWQQAFKRVVDLSLVVLFSPLFIIAFALLILVIRLDSAGGAFYSQKRKGKDGKEFVIWKFRTMRAGADEALTSFLKRDADYQTEWEENKKIKNDPRVTQVGKMLRRLSLDELPQVLNVIKGDMSLVGPRPIVEEEIEYYGNRYYLYTRVKPGLTGLWQVSGRNDTTYEDRVRYDEYYVRNWSIWLDIYILAKTIGAVLSGKGAY